MVNRIYIDFNPEEKKTSANYPLRQLVDSLDSEKAGQSPKASQSVNTNSSEKLSELGLFAKPNTSSLLWLKKIVILQNFS